MTPMQGITLCVLPALRVPGKKLPDPAGGSNKFFQLLWLKAREFQGPHLVSVCSPSALTWMEIDVKTTAP